MHMGFEVQTKTIYLQYSYIVHTTETSLDRGKTSLWFTAL